MRRLQYLFESENLFAKDKELYGLLNIWGSDSNVSWKKTGRHSNIDNLMDSMKLPVEQAMAALKIPEAD